MKFTDLLGLGKAIPLEKLIDVVSRGIGKLYKPSLDRKDTETEVQRIKALAAAIAESSKENLGIEYNTGGLKIATSGQVPAEVDSRNLTTPSIEYRAQNRIEFQELKKQSNIESVVQFAADQLKDEKTVTDKPLDDDWITRFFGSAGDISNEEMQALWGQILAGEIKNPKSYSLRTLDVVKNLSKEEAQIFTKAANFCITSNLKMIFRVNEPQNKNFITYSEILSLIDAGLMQPGENAALQVVGSEAMPFGFSAGEYKVFVWKNSNTPYVEIPMYMFSNAGSELLKVIQPNPPFDYLIAFANFIKKNGGNAKYVHDRTTTIPAPQLDFPEA